MLINGSLFPLDSAKNSDKEWHQPLSGHGAAVQKLLSRGYLSCYLHFHRNDHVHESIWILIKMISTCYIICWLYLLIVEHFIACFYSMFATLNCESDHFWRWLTLTVYWGAGLPGSRLPGEIVNNCAMSRVEGLKNGEFSPCGCGARGEANDQDKRQWCIEWSPCSFAPVCVQYTGWQQCPAKVTIMTAEWCIAAVLSTPQTTRLGILSFRLVATKRKSVCCSSGVGVFGDFTRQEHAEILGSPDKAAMGWNLETDSLYFMTSCWFLVALKNETWP